MSLCRTVLGAETSGPLRVVVGRRKRNGFNVLSRLSRMKLSAFLSENIYFNLSLSFR